MKEKCYKFDLMKNKEKGTRKFITPHVMCEI